MPADHDHELEWLIIIVILMLKKQPDIAKKNKSQQMQFKNSV